MRSLKEQANIPIAYLVEDVEWMAATGETVLGAATRLGIEPDSLARQLHRANRDDLYARLRRHQVREARR